MGTSSLLRLMLWLCAAAQSSLPCACAPTFRRETVHREVVAALQDPDAVASTDRSVVQASGGDVMPETVQHASDGDVVTEKVHQASDGDVVTEKDHQASDGDVVPEKVHQASDGDVVTEKVHQASDGDVVTEKDHQASDGDVVPETVHQASDGDVVSEKVHQASDGYVVPETSGLVDDNPVLVAKQVKQPEAKIHFQLLGKDSANLNYGDIWGPAQSHDLSQEKRIESTEALTYSGRFLLRLRFLLNMFYVWAIMCSVAAVQFLLLFAYHKSKGHIVKKHYVVNRV